MRRAVLLLVLGALIAPSCSSGGGGNKLPPLPPRKDPLSQLEVGQDQPEIPAPRVGEGEEFTKEQREFMRTSFKVFMYENDPPSPKASRPPKPPPPPGWTVRRERWIGMGPRATKTLVENMFVYLLAAQNAARQELARRAQAELVDLGAASVPYLVETLRLENFTDRQGNEQPVDELTRQTAAETLALIGKPAVGPLVRALPGAPDGSRRVIVKAMADLPGPPVTGALIARLDDESFVVAAEAATSLRTHPGREVTDRLVAVFGDKSRDLTVRNKAGTSLLRRKDPAAVPALVTTMERAKRDADYPLLKACGRILRRTTGLNLPDDPKLWREGLRERK